MPEDRQEEADEEVQRALEMIEQMDVAENPTARKLAELRDRRGGGRDTQGFEQLLLVVLVMFMTKMLD